MKVYILLEHWFLDRETHGTLVKGVYRNKIDAQLNEEHYSFREQGSSEEECSYEIQEMIVL